MSTNPVTNALVNKRAEIAGELLVAESRVDRLKSELLALDHTLALFDPQRVPNDILPIIRRARRERRFGFGAWTSTVLSVLRNAETPLTIREIAKRIAHECRMDISEAKAETKLAGRVRNTLIRQRADVVASEWDGSITLWRTVEPVDDEG